MLSTDANRPRHRSLRRRKLNAQGGALGRKYELVIQNHDGKPASAIEAAKKLVEDKGVSFFTGLNPSGTSLAIQSKMPGLNALFLDATAASNDLTGKNCTPNYFRIGITDGMQVNAFIELAKRSGVKSAPNADVNRAASASWRTLPNTRKPRR